MDGFYGPGNNCRQSVILNVANHYGFRIKPIIKKKPPELTDGFTVFIRPYEIT
jgi:hypothetical protein